MDIVDVHRMKKTLQRTPAFAKRIFTDEERVYCESKPRPEEHYAARFAAREAVLKALGCGFSGGVGFRDVSVSHAQTGKPVCVLTGKVKQIADDLGVIEIAISLSHTRDVAVANAVALTAHTKPEVPQKITPKEEFQRTFRNARALIDELDQLEAQGVEE